MLRMLDPVCVPSVRIPYTRHQVYSPATQQRADSQGGEIPPFRRTLTFAGHTFLSAPQDLSPRVHVSASHLRFPLCAVADAAFVTLTLTNHSVTPVSFDISSQEASSKFRFAPRVGVVPAGAAFVVAARFSPTTATAVVGTAALVFNGNAVAAHRIALSGAGYASAVTLDVGSRLVCAPTCVGAASKRTIRLHNASRLPAICRWDSGLASSGAFSMQPDCVMLRGETDAEVVCTFSPGCAGTFSAKAVCHVSSGDSAAACNAAGSNAAVQQSELVVSLRGESAPAVLSMEPSTAELGPVQVGHSSTVPLTVFNHSPGPVRYIIEGQLADGPLSALPASSQSTGEVGATPAPVLSVDRPCGTIPARSCVKVDVRVQPCERGKLRVKLVCRTAVLGERRRSDGSDVTPAPGAQVCVCVPVACRALRASQHTTCSRVRI